ncbi:MAG: nuclear transport factor 2 family protein [Myxococcota bacterium]
MSIARPDSTDSTHSPAHCPAQSLARLLHAIDTRDWAAARRQLGDHVEIDYRSLFGGAPQLVDANALIEQWRGMLTPLHSTQHLLGTPCVAIDGERAVVEAPVRGDHVAHGLPDGEQWMVAGMYTAHFERHDDRWVLTSLRLDAHHQTGNRQLLAQAGERMRSLPVGDGFSCELVHLSSMGDRIIGHLYLPSSTRGPVPGVVVLGSWTTVKEQMAGLYAQRLAQRGYAALAFDPRGHGQSAGALRNVESPAAKIEDVRAAAAFLARDPRVSGAGVGALGICAGAGYVAGAALDSPEISSVALVAPWLHDRGLVEAIYGGPEGVQKRRAWAEAALQRLAQTGEIEYVPAVSTTDERAAMFGAFEYYLDPARGAIDAWPNAFATMAWTEWLEFDPHPFAERLEQPVMIVHSEQGAVPEGARRFHARLSGPKEIRWLGGTQFDFYDDPPHVAEAVSIVAEHFAEARR